MKQKKILFIDRDGTLIVEPNDEQIDSLEKLEFTIGVIPALLKLKEAGYTLVMVSNQDGLGTTNFPEENFRIPHEFMLRIFSSQGIEFESIRICPHLPSQQCECRKPKIGLVKDYLIEQLLNRDHSYVIGDRLTDIQLAQNLGIKGIRIGDEDTLTWDDVAHKIISQPRTASITRNTKETAVKVWVDLDRNDKISIDTGLGFFDHMLEQLAKHGGFSLVIKNKGDLHVDDHHSVEDTAIALGEAIRVALGDKRGIGRYGFVLPMDDAQVKITLDLSGRFFFLIQGQFTRERVGDLSTELIPHFFRSLAEELKANLHIEFKGKNTHHMIEAIFKGLGRTLQQAIARNGADLPTTKGLL